MPNDPNYMKKWREEHRDKAREYDRRYRERKKSGIDDEWDYTNYNPRSQYRIAHVNFPNDLKKHKSQRSRSRTLGAPGSHTVYQVLMQSKRQGTLCAWCLRPLDDKYTIDHVMPIKRGGTDNAENIVLACRHCNDSRGELTLEEWILGKHRR